MSSYRDRWIEYTAGAIRIRGYYFPWGTKLIPDTPIHSVRRIDISTFTASEMYEIMGARPERVRKWVSCGYLRKQGNRGRAALYDRDDLLRVRREPGRRTIRPSARLMSRMPTSRYSWLITTNEVARHRFVDAFADVMDEAHHGTRLMWEFGRSLIRQAVKP